MTRLDFTLLLAFQFRRGPKAQPRKEQEDAFPIFNGKLRDLTGNRLILEVENGNTMEFRVQKSTRFLKGDKAAKPGQFKAGDEVAVECRHAPDASLDAVSVRSR